MIYACAEGPVRILLATGNLCSHLNSGRNLCDRAGCGGSCPLISLANHLHIIRTDHKIIHPQGRIRGKRHRRRPRRRCPDPQGRHRPCPRQELVPSVFRRIRREIVPRRRCPGPHAPLVRHRVRHRKLPPKATAAGGLLTEDSVKSAAVTCTVSPGCNTVVPSLVSPITFISSGTDHKIIHPRAVFVGNRHRSPSPQTMPRPPGPAQTVPRQELVPSVFRPHPPRDSTASSMPRPHGPLVRHSVRHRETAPKGHSRRRVAHRGLGQIRAVTCTVLPDVIQLFPSLVSPTTFISSAQTTR